MYKFTILYVGGSVRHMESNRLTLETHVTVKIE